MVSGIDRANAALERVVETLLSEGVAVREVNVALMGTTKERWLDEVGVDMLRYVLQGQINLIDDGAYSEGYLTPEAIEASEEEAQERRSRLTVIEGGGE